MLLSIAELLRDLEGVLVRKEETRDRKASLEMTFVLLLLILLLLLMLLVLVLLLLLLLLLNLFDLSVFLE